MELKEILLQLKSKYGFTNEECAINCGISISTWKRLINGKISNPRWDIIQLLAKGFAVPVDYFRNERDAHMLTLEEYENMRHYRSLPASVQDGIITIVEDQYKYWKEEYKKNSDYGFRLEFRRKCANLPISKVKELLHQIETKT